MAQTKEFRRVASVADIRMYPEDLATERGKLSYLGTSSTAEELVDVGALGGVPWCGRCSPAISSRLPDNG